MAIAGNLAVVLRVLNFLFPLKEHFISFAGRRRFLLIGVSVMAVSILTLGIISHYSPLGLHPTRKCHFVTQTRNFTEPASNQTHMANKGLRYLTLSALVLFVGAYSFSFGPGLFE